MANVLHPHIDFQPRPVSHAPSPFGFGFGLGPSPSTSMMPGSGCGTSTPGHTNPAAFHHLMASMTASTRPQKRRMSSEEEEENGRYSTTPRDESMDRSPTPEHPRYAQAKRARAANSSSLSPKDNSPSKQHKPRDSPDGNDIDVGVLLANLPTESLLPLLLDLLRQNPSLKSTLLPLIPRPTVDSAIKILSGYAEKLKQAYPYSADGQQSTMRPDYISSRLQQHVHDYVSNCMPYFTYFSCISSSPQTLPSTPGTNQNQTVLSTHLLNKTASSPFETFTFLNAVTEQILTQQSRAEVLKLLHDRLKVEWEGWLNKTRQDFDQARIYATEVRQKYAHALVNLAHSAAGTALADTMTTVSDALLKDQRYRWLFDSLYQHPMEQ